MILAVNTAEETLQLVLADSQGEVIAHYEEACAGRMNEVMGPAVQGLLRCHEKPAPLKAVACVRGPGSFTGVRLGLALATGLCLGRGIPLAGLSYLPLLGATVLRQGHTCLLSGAEPFPAENPPDASLGQGVPRTFELHILTHSRSARVYHQAFAREASGGAVSGEEFPAALGAPCDITVQEARQRIESAARKLPVVVAGSGLRRNHGALAAIGGAVFLDTENPHIEVLARRAAAARFDGPPVDALYLRGSDAEENLAAIAALRGLSEEEALRRMACAKQRPVV